MSQPSAVFHEGGCACGAVRFRVNNRPRRAGLCHCLTCRKSHGAAANPFVVFARDDFQFEGEVRHWQSSPHDLRSFCPQCGSPVFETSQDEIEIALGSFDDVSLFTPEYELWVKRREAWLAALDVPQFDQNRS
jgi:hypothetical protein